MFKTASLIIVCLLVVIVAAIHYLDIFNGIESSDISRDVVLQKEKEGGEFTPFVELMHGRDEQRVVPAGLLRTVQANLCPDMDYSGAQLIGAPWGRLYLWRFNGPYGVQYEFLPYEVGRPYDKSHVAQRDDVGSELHSGGNDAPVPGERNCTGEEEGYPLYFSSTSPYTYILHKDIVPIGDNAYGSVVLWDMDQNLPKGEWHGETDYLQDLYVSRDERLVAVHYYWMGTPGEALSFYRDDTWIAGIAAIGTSLKMASLNHANTAALIFIPGWTCCLLKLLSDIPATPEEWAELKSPEPIYASDMPGSERIESTSGTELIPLEADAAQDTLCAAFSPDDALLVVGGTTGSLQFFEGHSGIVLPPETMLGAAVTEMAFIPDGSKLIIRTDDSKIHVYRVSNRSVCYDPLLHAELRGMRLVRNGKHLLTWSDGALQSWCLETGQQDFPAISLGVPITGIEFAAEIPGTVILWSDTGLARLYDYFDGTPLTDLLHHGSSLAGATLSQGRLLTWDRAGIIREWIFSLPTIT